MHINLISLVAVILITALPAYCEPTTVVNNTITKFLYAMGGVVASSLIIYLGLTVYNRFFIKKSAWHPENNEFSAPTSTDEAIVSFIKRNRLR